jgi:hypothetical protein
VTSDGGVVVLNDASVYSVESGEETTTSSWSSGDEIAVDQAEESLTDLSNSEHVSAKRVGSTSDSNPYPDAGGEHSQETNASDGSIIVLDDGSIWEVESGDQSTASTWTDSSAITVNEGTASTYELVNTDEHETVHANYIGSE